MPRSPRPPPSSARSRMRTWSPTRWPLRRWAATPSPSSSPGPARSPTASSARSTRRCSRTTAMSCGSRRRTPAASPPAWRPRSTSPRTSSWATSPLSFTDLTIPVSGIPITVTRTYDTLTANDDGDFGFGWRLEFRDVDLRTSVTPTGEEADGIYNPFKVGTHVYVTLPGGTRQGFTFQPKVADGLRGSFLGIFEPDVRPRPGRHQLADGRPGRPANRRATATCSISAPAKPSTRLRPCSAARICSPPQDGLAYSIDGTTGQLTTVSDPHNNTLTFSDSGVTSSTGASVAFERNPQGRIAAVVDPMGNRIALPVRRRRQPGVGHGPHGQHHAVRLSLDPRTLPRSGDRSPGPDRRRAPITTPRAG